MKFLNSHLKPILLMNLNTVWETVANLGVPRCYAAKHVVPSSHAGTPTCGIYFIRKGVVRLSNIFPDGEERILLFFGKGTIFNETPVFTSDSSCIFTCIEDTEVVFWSEAQMLSIIRRNPDCSLNLLSSLGIKVQSFYTQLCDMRTYKTFENVCRILCSMALYQKEDGKIVPHLTRLDLAALLGVHRSSLHKAFSRLEDEGIIGIYSKKKLEIYDLQRLHVLAGLE